MIESILIQTPSKSFNCNINTFQNQKMVLDISQLNLIEEHSFDIKITFEMDIVEFRNHDYKWVNCKEDRIAGEYSPKIIKLKNNYLVQANINAGIWEFNVSNPKVLLWRFNPENAHPYTVYKGRENQKIIHQATQKIVFTENPALLFTTQNTVEFSRSLYPYTAIACFTDHCDFDTSENLKKQREFFATNAIKVTKGFFLNHFSKRENNPSYQNDAAELAFWRNDGHELAYHSLSQSIKSEKESREDFINFKPPFQAIPTWIDHGFQPYNHSLYQNFSISDKEYAENLKSKNITTLWNYIDSGTATEGVINQLNPNDFTLNQFNKGNKNLGFVARISQMIKNIIFHYYADEKIILKYKLTATNIKKIVYQKKLNYIFDLIINFIGLCIPILKVFIFWKATKNLPFKLAKYTPIIFKHKVENTDFYIFQTIEMVDFKKSLNSKNINKLITEKGVFIAHTYFSVPMNYHIGKLFKTPLVIDEEVANNFKNLGQKIKNQEIWNPTLNELIVYWQSFEKTILDIDSSGKIIVIEKSNLTFRSVN